mmetsp:Transcript_9221/g.15812  ORF Transcript_9221/g.15812 Transcript_9221/m.15812 type:complete len:234 (+) Transcript_9221:45-746(+)|eukprot:CAMPEP_0196655608 /NCGR_PEP_ID=MMETSP1086-20130531/5357_1 /TAXON_ID=77921 /ORGANISM="Cyanoptyche  gloeocystis , Strain SAG4.97" /LENGTH=233 /DNA_ID=CAMNT_0041988005 /DNA_START=45 /DNA_END=746 /DNA_ORIENTATION=-
MSVAAGCTLLPFGFNLVGSNTISPFRPIARDLMASYTRTIAADCDTEDNACLQAECASYGNYVHTDSFIEYQDYSPSSRQYEVKPHEAALLDERAIACTLLPEEYTTAFHPEDRKLFISPSRPDVAELEGRPSAAMVVEQVHGKGIPYFACATYGVPAGKYVRPGKIDKYVPSEEAARNDSAVEVVAETIQADEIESFPSLESYACDYVEDFSEDSTEDALGFIESADFNTYA